MKNSREVKLWREISWRDVLLAGFITIILAVGYFYVAGWDVINNTWREFLLSIIANLIPTPLLFIVAYILFHRIEELRTERDTDELADRVVFRLLEIAKAQSEASGDLRDNPIIVQYNLASCI